MWCTDVFPHSILLLRRSISWNSTQEQESTVIGTFWCHFTMARWIVKRVRNEIPDPPGTHRVTCWGRGSQCTRRCMLLNCSICTPCSRITLSHVIFKSKSHSRNCPHSLMAHFSRTIFSTRFVLCCCCWLLDERLQAACYALWVWFAAMASSWRARESIFKWRKMLISMLWQQQYAWYKRDILQIQIACFFCHPLVRQN